MIEKDKLVKRSQLLAVTSLYELTLGGDMVDSVIWSVTNLMPLAWDGNIIDTGKLKTGCCLDKME